MSSLCFCLISISLWALGGSPSLNVVIIFLSLCCLSALSLVSSSAWKGYFIIFVFVGGLLIFVIYLASLTNWSESAYSLVWAGTMLSGLILENESNESSMSMTSLFSSGTTEFWTSLLLLIFICLVISQILLAENTLRSYL